MRVLHKSAKSKAQPAARGGEESASRRRRQILEWMRANRSPVHGGDLARRFRVSRQSLVQDVAILRAGGQEILGTPRGYRLPDTVHHGHEAILACKHTPERTEEELNILA